MERAESLRKTSRALVAKAPVRAIHAGDELLRTVDVPRLVGSPARLYAATGWEPEIDLRATMRDVLSEARTRDARNPTT